MGGRPWGWGLVLRTVLSRLGSQQRAGVREGAGGVTPGLGLASQMAREAGGSLGRERRVGERERERRVTCTPREVCTELGIHCCIINHLKTLWPWSFPISQFLGLELWSADGLVLSCGLERPSPEGWTRLGTHFQGDSLTCQASWCQVLASLHVRLSTGQGT